MLCRTVPLIYPTWFIFVSLYCLGRSVGSRCFFAWLISSTPQAFLQPQSQGRPVCLSVCLRGTRLPQVAHMSSASRSCNTGSVIDPNQMLTGKKNVPLAALDELSSSTLVLILPSARCNTQDVAPWLATVRQNREFII